MPLLSRFTQLGHLELRASEPRVRSIYNAILSSYGPDYSREEGSRTEATAFAKAMSIGDALNALDQAANEDLPTKVFDMLPRREDEYGVPPGPNDTIKQRQDALAIAYLLPQGAKRVVVELGLQAILGSKFEAYYTPPESAIVTWPTNLGDQPMNLQLPSVTRKIVRLLTSVPFTGVAREVEYEAISTPVAVTTEGEASTLLQPGEKLVVEPGIAGIAETVEVTSVNSPDSGGHFFTATFTKAHSRDAVATTMPWPMWITNKRRNLVVVSDAATARDPETKRKVHNFMHRIMRGTSTWSIVVGSSSATTALEYGAPNLGVATIGTVSL